MLGFITTVIAWLVLATCAMAMYRTVQYQLLLMAMYGRSRYQSCRAITSLLGYKSNRILVQRFNKWLLFWIGTVFLIEHLQHSPQPFRELGNLWLPLIALMVGCVQFFGQARPAAILVLGACESPAIRLHRQIAGTMFPHRAVSLLETGNEDEDIRLIPGDCFRITIGPWEDAVWRFARSVFVIVVDMRKMTPAVCKELAFIVQEQLQFKTILINPDEAPLSATELEQCCICTTEAECLQKLESVFTSNDTLPSDHAPIRFARA